MTITLTIRPEVEAELARKAGLAGRALEIYAAELLEDAVQPMAETTAPTESLEQVFAKIRGLADGLDFSRNPSTTRTLTFG
jgi:hypothetical protein